MLKLMETTGKGFVAILSFFYKDNLATFLV